MYHRIWIPIFLMCLIPVTEKKDRYGIRPVVYLSPGHNKWIICHISSGSYGPPDSACSEQTGGGVTFCGVSSKQFESRQRGRKQECVTGIHSLGCIQ